MRWFTDAAYDSFYADDEAAWDRMLRDYTAHIAAIAGRLPPDVRALASDPT